MVNIKLRRDPTSSTLDIYDFKISLFDHGEPKEFLLFIHNFNMNLAATGTLGMDVKVHYLSSLVHVEAYHHFYFLSADVENTKTLNVDCYI